MKTLFTPHSEISQLEPQAIWQFFDQICSFPHPSKHEEALAQFIIDWAKSQSLEVKRDETGNVFIKKPAFPGMEHKKPVVLQAHIDMVLLFVIELTIFLCNLHHKGFFWNKP